MRIYIDPAAPGGDRTVIVVRAPVPPGKTCADCARFDLCTSQFQARPDDVACVFGRPQFAPCPVDYSRITRELCA